MKNRTLFLTLGALAVIGLGAFRLAIAQPALGATVSYDLQPGDDLPMFDGDLDEVKFETLAGSYYAWQRTTGVGPCAYDVEMWGDLQLVVDALGGELYALERWEPSETFVGTGPGTLDTGYQTESVTDTAGRTIYSDTRCDNFEGTGTIALSWAPKTNGGVAGTGCNFGPQTSTHILSNVTVRVTYTPK
jgi:hypothetical protein